MSLSHRTLRFISLVTLLAFAPANASEGPGSAVQLRFDELVTPTRKELKPSERLLSLKGKRVRLSGFMAKMEIPPRGGFYLTADPVVCDEAGGGTADLPPNAVYVVVRSLAGEVVPFTPRQLEVTGVVDLGYRVEADGRATFLRLTLDRIEDQAPAAQTQGSSRTTSTANAGSSARTQEKP